MVGCCSGPGGGGGGASSSGGGGGGSDSGRKRTYRGWGSRSPQKGFIKEGKALAWRRPRDFCLPRGLRAAVAGLEIPVLYQHFSSSYPEVLPPPAYACCRRRRAAAAAAPPPWRSMANSAAAFVSSLFSTTASLIKLPAEALDAEAPAPLGGGALVASFRCHALLRPHPQCFLRPLASTGKQQGAAPLPSHRHRTAALPLDVSAPVRSWPAGVAPRGAGKDFGAANETRVGLFVLQAALSLPPCLSCYQAGGSGDS